MKTLREKYKHPLEGEVEATIMENLSFHKENLLPKEEIIDNFSPIEYKGTKFDCIIKMLRIKIISVKLNLQ